MTERGNGEATIAEIRQILGYFRTLRDAVRKPLPELNAGLWEQAKQEAKVELLEELRRREHGMTLQSATAGTSPGLFQSISHTI